VAYQISPEQKSGIKGYSLFFAPSREMRTASPCINDLWDMGPTAEPYDTMHLAPFNVVPHMWKRLAGSKLVSNEEGEAYITPRSTMELAGRELRDARRTVPRAQPRSLRNIDSHRKSFKAVDWMHIIWCTGEVLLAGRLPREYYNIFMALCRAFSLFFRPRGVSEAEIKSIGDDIKYFVANCYAKIFCCSV